MLNVSFNNNINKEPTGSIVSFNNHINKEPSIQIREPIILISHSNHHNMKRRKCEDGVTDAGLQQHVSGSTPHK